MVVRMPDHFKSGCVGEKNMSDGNSSPPPQGKPRNGKCVQFSSKHQVHSGEDQLAQQQTLAAKKVSIPSVKWPTFLCVETPGRRARKRLHQR